MPRINATCDVSYNCTTQTVTFTNIQSDPPVAYMWALVMSNLGTPPGSDHPYVYYAKKGAVANGSATIRDPVWPNFGSYVVYYWFDFGFAKASTGTRTCSREEPAQKKPGKPTKKKKGRK